MLFFFWLSLYSVHASQLEITVIDVNQGDSILIAFPPNGDGERKHMLIDGGPSVADNNTVVQLLRSKNIEILDVLVLTHPHLDHYGGLIPVLNHFSVKEFWWNGEDRGQSRNEKTPKTWTDFEDARARVDKEVLVVCS